MSLKSMLRPSSEIDKRPAFDLMQHGDIETAFDFVNFPPRRIIHHPVVFYAERLENPEILR